jgi:ATP-binding cassette subfamily C protein
VNTASAPTPDETSLSARETVKALSACVRPHRWAVVLGLLCALVGAAGGLLQPLATKTLVDRLATGETIAGILIALTALVVLARRSRRSARMCWSGPRSRWSWPRGAP